MARALGCDVGTMFFQVAEKDGDDLTFKVVRNAFVELPASEDAEDILSRNGWQYVKDGNSYYVIGDDAMQVANIFPGKAEVRRPLQDGVLNKNEDKKLLVLAEIIRQAVGESDGENSWVCTCVSSASVDGSADSVFHRQRLEALFKRLGWNVKILEEGHAVILAERPVVFEDGQEIAYSGIGVSFGAGRANCVLAYRGLPVIGMSVARCLAEDSLVTTEKGLLPISSIKIGDTVIDAFGKKSEVLDVLNNGVREKILSIKVSGLPSFPINCTRDHKIWIKRANGWEWEEAEKIQPGDIVGERIRYFDDSSPSAVYIGRKDKKSIRPMKSRDLGRFFGAFLGDGSTKIDNNGYGYVQIAFNSNDDRYLDKYLEISSNLWDCDPEISHDLDVYCSRLKIHRSYLANYMKNKFYDALGYKKIPFSDEDISDQMALGLIEGMLDTDGHIDRTRSESYGFTNTSLEVCSLLHRLLSRFGIRHSFSKRDPRLGGTNSRGEQIIGKKETYEISIPILSSRILDAFLSVEGNGFYYQKHEYAEYSVISVEDIEYGKEVYDIKVSSDHHSFGILGAIVHNCGDWVDKMVSEQTGVPLSQVVATKEKKLDFENIDFDDDVQFALDAYYDQLIRHVFTHFGKKFSSEKSQFNAPLDIVVAGGTSMPNGFTKKVEKVVQGLDLPFEIKEVRGATNPRTAVVEGLYASAVVAQKKAAKQSE